MTQQRDDPNTAVVISHLKCTSEFKLKKRNQGMLKTNKQKVI